jgi:hypothetical protein
MAADQHADLLRRFQPALRYDSQEAFFADHPEQMVVNPGNQLRRLDGTVARADDGTLTLATLGARYPDGAQAAAGDVLSIAGKDYAKQYAALREARPELKNHVVAHAATDADGRLWLQYWLWYFYNDYRLAANYGLHEGDWEMVQLRLDGDRPDYAVYAQHTHAERRPWDRVHKDPNNADTPLVYVARGSHASYFRPGVYQTDAWADVCDGDRPAPALAPILLDATTTWAAWPGRWGDTKAATTGPGKSLTSNSPDGPCRHAQFKDPKKLFDDAYEQLDPQDPVPGPVFGVGRRNGLLVVNYTMKWVVGHATEIIITVNSKQEPGTPPKTTTLPLPKVNGVLATPIPVDAAKTYEVRLSVEVTTTSGTVLPSVTVARTLDPGDHEPHRLPTTKAGVALVSAAQLITKLFGRR